ncbi:hypothetical protein OUZ56_018637 [Daphnia magna]|uniref:Uncharacterized protein n=1 Tax=Daphnia magna TaxID=35525 RepID=A0ABQ9Z9G3_9CRUS|nr:hypothetical protein OUZ56_018637 [Daphnia magna]
MRMGDELPSSGKCAILLFDGLIRPEICKKEKVPTLVSPPFLLSLPFVSSQQPSSPCRTPAVQACQGVLTEAVRAPPVITARLILKWHQINASPITLALILGTVLAR